MALKSSVNTHLRARASMRVVTYLTLWEPVEDKAPTIPPSMDKRENSPGRAHTKAVPKGKNSEKTDVPDMQNESIPQPSCAITVCAMPTPFCS